MFRNEQSYTVTPWKQIGGSRAEPGEYRRVCNRRKNHEPQPGHGWILWVKSNIFYNSITITSNIMAFFYLIWKVCTEIWWFHDVFQVSSSFMMRPNSYDSFCCFTRLPGEFLPLRSTFSAAGAFCFRQRKRHRVSVARRFRVGRWEIRSWWRGAQHVRGCLGTEVWNQRLLYPS